ncbi:hypothetical protein QE405_002175 [Nocardioides zeae]|uniref:Uncharacterized protein n=1 Tax=Nocardioides zeae TaxID=1457234 RepID=A0AAJ1U5J8_9ACTN|nr:hypothetical protein [Nocardioides zeae]
MADRALGTVSSMKILRTAALITVGKKLYDESRKPQNKAKIDRAVQSLRDRRAGGKRSR